MSKVQQECAFVEHQFAISTLEQEIKAAEHKLEITNLKHELGAVKQDLDSAREELVAQRLDAAKLTHPELENQSSILNTTQDLIAPRKGLTRKKSMPL